MLVIGLTGGIATGKSTVSSLLASHNIPIIDADVLARKVVEPGTPALAKIIRHFGHSMLLPDGSLDRKKLGAIVFANEGSRKALNGIVHPAVSKAIVWDVVWCWLRGEKVCVVDVPLLIEGGLWKWVGKVVVVYCSAELQLQRLMARDKSSQAEASSRLSSQLPISQKVTFADAIIDNSGSLSDLEGQVNAFVQKVIREVEGTWGVWWRLCWVLPFVGVFSALWLVGWRTIWRWRKSSRDKAKGKAKK